MSKPDLIKLIAGCTKQLKGVEEQICYAQISDVDKEVIHDLNDHRRHLLNKLSEFKGRLVLLGVPVTPTIDFDHHS